MSSIRHKETLSKYIWKNRAVYSMLILPVVYFIIFKYLPMFGNILAFRRYRPGMGPWGTEWVGLEYFKRFMADENFWRAFRNTLVTSLCNVVINFPLPIIFAIILNEARVKWFKKITQTVSYMPRFISAVVIIAMLGEILSPSSGLLNRFLVNTFGIEPIYFINLPQWFRPIYIFTDSWQFTGWTAIIYLAAITNISPDLYEAAEIDGASRIGKIIYVTIPSIMPTIMVMLILQIGRILTLGFEKILLLYTPANSHVSDIIDTLVYRTGLAGGMPNYSYATAIGLFSSVIALVLVSSANFTSRKFTGESIY
ncbi:MAG: ABC transporter permease subunit [Spirochaetaceae bacterium]|jgi:putative aldouronate transport system permease protein|nr:ABC transporter permease subunit [Spirochaetaceae bacterium]